MASINQQAGELDLAALDLGEFARPSEDGAAAAAVHSPAPGPPLPLYEPGDPLTLLHAYRVPVSPVEAIRFLAWRVEPVRVLALYQHYFPAEFAASKARMLPREDEPYSDAEMEFFRLVDAHLFPIHAQYFDLIIDDWYETLEEDYGEDAAAMRAGTRVAARSMWIPLATEALEVWNYVPEDFRPGWYLLFLLEGVTSLERIPKSAPCLAWRDDLEEYLKRFRFKGLPLYSPHALYETLAQRTARREGEEAPLRHLSLALRVLSHDTGNIWLDLVEENVMMTQDLVWDREIVDGLAQDYKGAQSILGEVDELLSWIEADPKNERKLFELWRTSAEEHRFDIAGLVPTGASLDEIRSRLADLIDRGAPDGPIERMRHELLAARRGEPR